MLKKLFLSAVLCTASMVAMAQSQIITHVVQRGETLESIAKYYNISVADLNNANPNADGIIYVGMKLAVPVATTTVSTTSSTITTPATPAQDLSHQDRSETMPTGTQSYTDTPRTEISHNTPRSSWQRNQALMTYGLTFFSADFGHVKESGHYGITMDFLNLYNSLFGASLTLGSFNFGLVDRDFVSDVILWGPNIAYEVTKGLRIAAPIQVMTIMNFDDKGDSKTSWGWAISPRLYYSFGKVTINTGILINGGFKSKESATCGFVVGIGL